MESQEAAGLIRAISSSLRANPAQFQINVSMSGFSAQNTGGVGYVAQNTGGVGFSSNMGNASVVLLHGFIKKSQATPAPDMKLEKDRMRSK